MAKRRLSDAVGEFMAYGKSAYADSTLRSIRYILDVFLTETGNIWVNNITDTHVDRALAASLARGVSPATINNHVTWLNVFCDFCRKRKLAPATWDPMGHRRRQKVVPKARLRIPADQFPLLLDSAANARDRAAYAIGLYLMVRESELLGLKLSDLNLADGRCTVRIYKTRRLDHMPISSELDQEMRDWLEAYASAVDGPMQPQWYLVPTKPGGARNKRDERGRLLPWDGPLRLQPDRQPTRLDLALKKTLTRMGYPDEDLDGVGLHTLRRSAARARFDVLAAQGYDGALRQVASLLHHESTMTTETYLGIDVDAKRRDEDLTGKPMYGNVSTARRRAHLRVVGGSDGKSV